MDQDLLDRIGELVGPRDVVTVTGGDAATYLQSQVSQDLAGMDDGDHRWSFLLAPNGRVEALARVTRRSAERYELDTDAGFGASLADRLRRFMIRVDAEVEVTEAEHAEIDPTAERERIRIGWPRLGSDIILGESIPAGTGLTGVAVSFTKGCYPGQELVERMDSRAAESPKTLRRLEVADDVAVGDAITVDGAEVGIITSVAAPYALGWVKRSSDIGTELGW